MYVTHIRPLLDITRAIQIILAYECDKMQSNLNKMLVKPVASFEQIEFLRNKGAALGSEANFAKQDASAANAPDKVANRKYLCSIFL